MNRARVVREEVCLGVGGYLAGESYVGFVGLGAGGEHPGFPIGS